MHLSQKELNIAYAIYGGPEVYREKWYEKAIARRAGRWSPEAPEQIKGGSVDGPQSLPETPGEVYPEVGQHSDGCECYATWEDYDAFAP